MTNISPAKKTIARELKSLAGTAAVAFTDYWDDAHSSRIVIFKAANVPQLGVATYSTVGLCEVPLLRGARDPSIRTDIIGACDSSFPGFENIISTAAFCVINFRVALCARRHLS
jgi:antitoxin YqcF